MQMKGISKTQIDGISKTQMDGILKNIWIEGADDIAMCAFKKRTLIANIYILVYQTHYLL